MVYWFNLGNIEKKGLVLAVINFTNLNWLYIFKKFSMLPYLSPCWSRSKLNNYFWLI